MAMGCAFIFRVTGTGAVRCAGKRKDWIVEHGGKSNETVVARMMDDIQFQQEDRNRNEYDVTIAELYAGENYCPVTFYKVSVVVNCLSFLAGVIELENPEGYHEALPTILRNDAEKMVDALVTSLTQRQLNGGNCD